MSLDFKRILCPIDMSEFSLEALKLGAKIADISGASMSLLHVIDNPFDELYMKSITQADPALFELYQKQPHRRSRIVAALVDHAEVMLKQFCHESIKQIPRVRYTVRTGDPFENIIDVAEDHRIDLIVLATHGRTGLRRLLIGNVAEKVVRHAPCPVLTVKPRGGSRAAKRT
jgi:nucleotide-binding universal stress UspA family protein